MGDTAKAMGEVEEDDDSGDEGGDKGGDMNVGEEVAMGSARKPRQRPTTQER